MKLKKILAIVMLASLFVVSYANSPSGWVDNGIVLRQGANIEWQRTGAAIGEDAVVFVWSDTRISDRDLYAQAVNQDGLVWNDGVSTMIDGKENRQEDPVIIRTSDGNVIIAWIDFHWQVADIEEGCVVAQKLSADGELMWEHSAHVSILNYAIALNIVPDEDGGAHIIWHDNRAGTGIEIYGMHLNGDGEPYSEEWIEDGKLLATGSGNQHFHTFWHDGENGAILAYISEVDDHQDLYVKRLAPNGNIIWEKELAVSDSVDYASVRVQPFGDDAFGFAYTDRRDDFFKIYVKAFSTEDGEELWDESKPVDPEADGQSYDHKAPRVVGTSDGHFAVTWEDYRSGVADIYVQKFDIEGNRLWDERGVPIVINELNQLEPRMESDGEGGVLLVWEDGREGGHPNIDIYMQWVDKDGKIKWEENGRAVCVVEGETLAPLVKFSGDHFFVGWGDMRTGSVGVYCQGYTLDGEPLFQENGIEVFWGLSGDSIDHNAVKNGDYVYTVWQDTRYANFGSQIKVQKIDSDGKLHYEKNGISVTSHTGANQKRGTGQNAISVIPHHSGGIALTWVEQREDYELVYAQAIGPDGEMLWDPNGDGKGIRVSVTDDRYTQDNPVISSRDEEYFIAWDETDPGDDFSFVRDIRAQKIVNGERMWGDEGIHIAWQFGEYQIDHYVRQFLDGEYILWTRGGEWGQATEEKFYLKKITADGTVAEGWDDYGLLVCGYPGYIQIRPTAVSTGDGIVILWEDQRAREGAPINTSIYGQYVTADGEIQWQENGKMFVDYDNDQSYISAQYHDGYVYFTWRDARVDASAQDIAFQKIDLEGNIMWGDPAPFVVRSRIEQDTPTISVVDDKVLVVWENNYGEMGSDLHMQLASAEAAETYWDSEGEILVSTIKRQFRPRAMPFDDHNSFVIWSDARSSGKEEIIGLYAQKVDMFFGNVKDSELVPANQMVLHNNYPNPFNPETTISFSLGKNEIISLNVYNVKGQLIKSLVNNEYLERGTYNFVWNGTNEQGNNTGSGVYFYKLEGEKHTQIKKMLLLK